MEEHIVLKYKNARTTSSTKLWALIAVLLIHLSAFAQSKTNLDSLAQAIKSYPREDTTKAKMWIEYANESRGRNPNAGLEAANKALQITEKMSAPGLAAAAYFAKAFHQDALNDYKEALVSYDKALALYEHEKNHPKTIAVLYGIGTTYFNQSDAANAKKFIDSGLKLAESTNNSSLLATGYNNMGNVCNMTSEYSAAVTYFDKAINAMGDNPVQRTLAIRLSNKGNSLVSMGDLQSAIVCFQKALSINERLDIKLQMAYNYNGLGDIYAQLNENRKALEYYNKALEINTKINKKKLIAETVNSIGLCYIRMGDNNTALTWFEKAIALEEEIGSVAAFTSVGNNLSAVYIEKKEYLKAYNIQQRVFTNASKIGQKSSVVFSLLGTTELYLLMSDSLLSAIGVPPSERYTKAYSTVMSAIQIAEPLKKLPLDRDCYKLLSNVCEKMGDYRKAHDAYKTYMALSDTLSGDELRKKILKRELQYEFEKKETGLLHRQALTEKELEQSRLLAIQQKQTLRLNEQALLLSNKEKDIAHLAYLKEIADRQEKEQLLVMAKKDNELQDYQLDAVTKQKVIQAQALSRQNTLIGFLISSIAALALGIVAIYLWVSQRGAKKMQAAQTQFTQQLIENAEIERGRIARDLHDGISHELLSLKRNMSSANIDDAQKIDHIIEDVRHISRDLHPVMLQSLGLKLSLETICDQYSERGELFVSHEINYNKELSETAELQVFRIIQEALSNTQKYAKAEAALVRVSQTPHSMSVWIEDNGQGFDVAETLESGKSFGINNIIYRSEMLGQKAVIQSSKKGTKISFTIPTKLV